MLLYQVRVCTLGYNPPGIVHSFLKDFIDELELRSFPANEISHQIKYLRTYYDL